MYCHRFDILIQSSRIYFVACTVGTYVGRSGGGGRGLLNANSASPVSSFVSPPPPFPSVRRGSARHLRGSGRDADGPARLALPGALHSAHQPHRGAVPQGVAPVLDWEWICGEYQFDMTAKHPRTDKKKQTKKTTSRTKST